MSPSLLSLWGRSLDEVLGKTFSELGYPAELLSLHGAQLREALGGRTVRGENAYTSAAGKVGYYEYIFAPVVGPAGEVEAIAGTTRDITERRNTDQRREAAFEQVLASDAQLQAILDHAPAVVSILDLDGRYRFVNRAHADLFGVQASSVLGKTPQEAFPDHAQEHIEDGFTNTQRVIETGEPIEFEELISVGREVRTYLSLKFPLQDSEGRTYAVCGISVDVTERKRLDEMRDRFIGILGHDLRTPVSAVSLSAHVLLQSENLPPHAQRMLKNIARSAGRMDRMIGELLDFARGRLGGGISIARSPTDLDALVQEICEEAKSAFGNLPLQLARKGDLRGSWDGARLAQVTSNLISNAAQYRRPGTKVRVDLDGSTDLVALRVSNDTDQPLPAEPQRLFEPFQRTAQARARGLGLGLYIARQIVLAHGGSIEAEHTLDGEFTITVSLPRH